MESFLRRLKYYGIGFGFGLLFVIFFFKNRGCSWLPSNRVKNSISERMLVLPENEARILSKSGLKDAEIRNLIEQGDVDFSASLKHSDPKVYQIDGETKNGKEIRLYLTLPSESFISEVHFSEQTINKVKNSTEGMGKILSFPKDDHLFFMDSTKAMEEWKKKLGISSADKLFTLIKSSGKIDFSKTNYMIKPKSEQYISFTGPKGRDLGLVAVWYKNKIDVVSFDTLSKKSTD